MAPTSKPREKRRKNFFFTSSCCFGSYQERDHDDGMLFKFSSGKKSSQRVKTVPISDSSFMKAMNLSKDTHMVVKVEANDHMLLPLRDKIIVNKDMVTEKGTILAADGSVKKTKMNAGADQFDPLVGALILITALIVMLVWGKVSAILCTAIWFYLLPRLTRLNNKADSYGTRLGNGLDQIDLGSMENKKKVILQGFLDRN